MRLLTFTLLTCLFLISCSNNNGTYVVYKVNDNNTSDDTIKAVLKNHLMGSKYKVTFTDKYASMESAKKMTLYLPVNPEVAEYTEYMQTSDSHGGRYIMRLKVNEDGTLTYHVALTSEHDRLFSPVQLAGPIPPTGVIDCWLSKTSD